jgi:hypothetical protein
MIPTGMSARLNDRDRDRDTGTVPVRTGSLPILVRGGRWIMGIGLKIMLFPSSVVSIGVSFESIERALLSPFWSCLVLALLFNPLNEALATRANDPLQRSIFGDDGRGTRSANMAYFNDSLLFPAYEQDLSFILTFILQKGPALGIFLGIPKTKLLTLPANTPSTVLTTSQTTHLATALTIINGPSSIVTAQQHHDSNKQLINFISDALTPKQPPALSFVFAPQRHFRISLQPMCTPTWKTSTYTPMTWSSSFSKSIATPRHPLWHELPAKPCYRHWPITSQPSPSVQEALVFETLPYPPFQHALSHYFNPFAMQRSAFPIAKIQQNSTNSQPFTRNNFHILGETQRRPTSLYEPLEHYSHLSTKPPNPYLLTLQSRRYPFTLSFITPS